MEDMGWGNSPVDYNMDLIFPSSVMPLSPEDFLRNIRVNAVAPEAMTTCYKAYTFFVKFCGELHEENIGRCRRQTNNADKYTDVDGVATSEEKLELC